MWVGRYQAIVHCICNFFPFSWNFKKLKLLHCRDRVSCCRALTAVATATLCQWQRVGYAFPQKKIPQRKVPAFPVCQKLLLQHICIAHNRSKKCTSEQSQEMWSFPGSSVQSSPVYQEHLH